MKRRDALKAILPVTVIGAACQSEVATLDEIDPNKVYLLTMKGSLLFQTAEEIHRLWSTLWEGKERIPKLIIIPENMATLIAL